MKKHLKLMAIALVISIMFATVFATSRQIIRMSANDPQLQLAKETAEKLDQDAALGSLTTGRINLPYSLSPFIQVYDKKGQLVVNNVYINSKPLKSIPKRLLEHTNRDYHSITWQPDPNIRLATVVVKSHDYYVVSARSLQEVESRISSVFKVIILGWLTSLAILGGYYYLRGYSKDSHHSIKSKG